MSEELNLIEISDEDQNKKLSTIVKMDNDLLVKGFPNFSKKWTPFDIDWWNIIDSQVLDQKDNLIKIPISKVKELMYFRKHITNDEFIKKSNDTLKKFMTIQASLEQEDGDKKIYMNVNIFSQSYIDTDYNAWIRVSPQATKYFNNLSQWTRFALEQATRLHTSYSKKLFMYLKQWRTVGKKTFTLEEFRNALDVPKSYRPGSIDQKILNPTAEYLAPYFMNFRITKNYSKGIRGRKLIGYTFTFRPESKTQKDVGYNKRIEETTHLYSIMTNTYLNTEQKFHAIDRYRGLKLGTTKKYYESAHPQTVFLDPESDHRRKRGITHRSDLYGLSGYKIADLEAIIITYEDLLKNGKLKEWDLQDLAIIERACFDKQIKLAAKTEHSDKPYIPHRKILINSLVIQLIDSHRLDDYKSESVDLEINRLVRENFGKYKREEDKRQYELKFDFE